MNDDFQKIWNTVWKFSLLILIMGVVSGVSRAQPQWEFRFPLLILSWPLAVIVNGWIVGTLYPARAGSALDILKTHWVHFLVVTLVLGIAFIPAALPMRLWGSSIPILVRSLALILIRTAYDWAIVYIIPLVFIRKIHLTAIPSGLVFLRQNIRTSGGLFIGLLVSNSLLMGSSLVDRMLEWDGSFVLGVLMVVVAVFGRVLVFAGAVQQLVERHQSEGP